MANPPAILVSWVAVNNDPYERNRDRTYRTDRDGAHIVGPTLTVLADPNSPWFGKIDTLVLFHRHQEPGEVSREREAVEQLTSELRRLLPSLKLDLRQWYGENPTDHKGIYQFLQQEMPGVRTRYVGRELLVHISPGTSSMHTVWVLMVETGLIAGPVRLIQSYRKDDRRPGQSAVEDVSVGLESFYQAWQGSRPAQASADVDAIAWNPQNFRTEQLRDLWRQAQRYARIAVPVLILGERGTGKTTLAGWIRASSPYRRKELDGNWPAVACGQYSPELMRAELFGYEKGAFTGAVQRQDGLLARADGDTLFLDEIGDISRDVQRLLIKAVEEGTFQPLGTTKSRASTFRLLSATNLAEGKLQERLDLDFLDRIAPLRLRVPPLREIADELDWLWPSTLAQARVRARVAGHVGKENPRMDAAIVERLKRHPLPGNLRDLLGVAYRLLAHLGDRNADKTAAVEFALAGIESSGAAPAGATRVQRIAAAWAGGSPLGPQLDSERPLETDRAIAAFKRYLADQLRREAVRRKVKVEALCDQSERTLRNWVADEAGK